MWEFVAEYDEGLYQRIIKSIETSKSTATIFTNIQSFMHVAVKKLWVDNAREIKFYRQSNNNLIEDNNPSMLSFLNNSAFNTFIANEVGFSLKPMKKLIMNFANVDKHGPRQDSEGGQNITRYIEHTDDEKIRAYKFLFDYCKAVYEFSLKKSCPVVWDEGYFYDNSYSNDEVIELIEQIDALKNDCQRLADTEQENEALKSSIQSALIEIAELKESIQKSTVDEEEHNNLLLKYEQEKTKYENLLAQTEKNDKTKITDSNAEILSALAVVQRLENGSFCLKEKDFSGARKEFLICLDKDKLNVQAYIGLLLAEVEVSTQEDLRAVGTSLALTETEAYRLSKRNNAILALESFNKLFTDCFNAWLNAAVVNIKNGNFEATELYCRSCIENGYEDEDILTAIVLAQSRTRNILSVKMLSPYSFEYFKSLRKSDKVKQNVRDWIENIIFNTACHVSTKEEYKAVESYIEILSNPEYIEHIKRQRFIVDCITDGKLKMPLSNSIKLLEWNKDIVCSGLADDLNYVVFSNGIDFPIPLTVKSLVLDANEKYILKLADNLDKVNSLCLPLRFEAGESRYSFPTKSQINIELGKNTTTICKDAFKDSKYSIVSVKLSASTSVIEQGAFNNCDNLEEVLVDAENEIYESNDGVLYKKNPFSIVHVPKCIKGSLTVKEGISSIGDSAFSKCRQLIRINLPEGISDIGANAFAECSNLSYINIPNSVTGIGECAFKGCTAEINWENNVAIAEIGSKAFCNYYGKTLTIPRKIKVINSEAFSGCRAAIVWENNTLIKKLLNRAFYNYQGYELVLPDKIKIAGEEIFGECKSIIKWNSECAIEEIPNGMFKNYKGQSIEIPQGIINIGKKAFEGCSELKSISLPNSVISIGEHAFSNCSNLLSFTFGNNISTVGSDAFSGCDNLKKFHVPSLRIWCEMSFPYPFERDDSFYKNKRSTLLYVKDKLIEGDIIIPNGTTKICEYSFAYYKNIGSVKIPDSVKSIEGHAFANCTTLQSVTIGNNVKTIGEYAFYNCKADIIWEDSPSITELEKYAFFGYKGSLLTLPNSIKKIGHGAFKGCSELKNIGVPQECISIGTGAFDGCSASIQWSGDCTKMTMLEKRAFEGYLGKSISIPDGIEVISDAAFYGCKNLENIVIPNSVTRIGLRAFSNCAKLNRIDICDLKAWCEIEYDANDFVTHGSYPLVAARSNSLYLNGCLVQGSLSIPTGTQKIAKYAFYNLTNITDVNVPESVTSIEEGAFGKCSSLIEVTNSDGIQTLGKYAFSETEWEKQQPCGALYFGKILYSYKSQSKYPNIKGSTVDKVLVIKNGTRTIAESACCYSDLTKVIMPYGVETIGDGAFHGCNDLKTVDLPESLVSIGREAFRWCENLSCVTIPQNVKNIGIKAFEGCKRLESIVVPNTVNKIGDDAFDSCYSLKHVSAPLSIIPYISIESIETLNITGGSSIRAHLFESCEKLKSITIADSIKKIADQAFNMNRIYSFTEVEQIAAPAYAIKYIPRKHIRTAKITSGETIESKAFKNCPELTTITLASSIKKIEKYAFWECEKLRTIYFMGSDEQWKNILVEDGNHFFKKAKVVFINECDEKEHDIANTECELQSDTTLINKVLNTANAKQADAEPRQSCQELATCDDDSKLSLTSIETGMTEKASSNVAESGAQVETKENEVVAADSNIDEKKESSSVKKFLEYATATQLLVVLPFIFLWAALFSNGFGPNVGCKISSLIFAILLLCRSLLIIILTHKFPDKKESMGRVWFGFLLGIVTTILSAVFIY